MVTVHYAILGSCYPPMSFGDNGKSFLYLFPLITKTIVKLLEPSGRQKGSVSLKARSTKTEQLQRNPEYTSKQSLAPPTNISCFLRNLSISSPHIVTHGRWSAKQDLMSWLSKDSNYQTQQGLTSTTVNTATSFFDLGLC